MGIYVNPGNVLFETARFSDIYVDKSMLIARTNALYKKERRFICVSRPRRFGKSMAANMLAAYYSRGCDSAEVFAGLKIEKEASFKKYLNQCNVIRMDIQRFLDTEKDLDVYLDEIEKNVVLELLKEFPECTAIDSSSKLKTALDQIFVQTGKGFIFIVDEWDCVFRIARKRKEAQKEYLDFLRGLFKGADYVELAYMTGILPIKKYGEHSAVNIFDEYSMISPKNLGEYFGFTEEEVCVQCEQQDMEYAEVKKWYDGYLIGNLHIYNPKSVVDALTWKELESYWTGTYEALKVYIDLNFDGLKEAIAIMLGNGRCAIDSTTFQNDMTTFQTKDDVLTLLVHLGYLTYDWKTSEVFIPNQEIEQEFMRAMKVGGWDGMIQPQLHRGSSNKKVVIAIDSFKGSMSSMEAGNAAKAGILRACDAEIIVKPLADGGEGTTEALVEGMGGEYVSVEVMGPLGTKTKARYGILGDKRTAVMEMAEAAGIILLKPEELNPLRATTYGVGEMILDAVKRGCREFIIGIGGSATSEGGVGMLQALGYEFKDKDGNPIREGLKDLDRIVSISGENVPEALNECHFSIACDVTNPLCGENGAVYVYGPQKGVKEEEKPIFDGKMVHYAYKTQEYRGVDYRMAEGAGAAGGRGFAFLSYIPNVELKSGIDIVLEAIGLEQAVRDADIVITGEGRMDFQTAMGKVPVGVARLAKKYGAKVLAFAGGVTRDAGECNEVGIDAFFPIVRGVTTLKEAMTPENARENMILSVEQVFRAMI